MYLVTGGAGFIGSNIVASLEEKGLGPIVVCDRLRDGVKWKNLAKRELMDVVHPDDLDDFLEANRGGITAIFHMGAISATTEFDADKVFENNFRLSMRLWDWCAENETPLIYASSAATYGDGENGFVDDQSMDHLGKLRPLNPYGWSKNLFDRRVVRMVADGEPTPTQWAGLKFFNVYGPNEAHKGSMKSVVAHLYPKIKAGEAAVLFQSHHPDYEDGGQTRDFVHVDDCVSLMMWLMENPSVSGLFNCGTGTPRTFADLARAVFAALGKPENIGFVPTPESIRDKYQYFTQADMTKARDAGYDKPFMSLEDGVARYVKDFLDSADSFK